MGTQLRRLHRVVLPVVVRDQKSAIAIVQLPVGSASTGLRPNWASDGMSRERAGPRNRGGDIGDIDRAGPI